MAESIKSAQRTMQIVKLLTGAGPQSFTEISQGLEFPRSSLHGLLGTMVEEGFLSLDDVSRRYHLGLRVWEAGQAYRRDKELVRAAMPYLQAICDVLNETAQLAILDGTDNVYLAKVESDHMLMLASQVGSRLPAHTTALGKALLSGSNDDDVRRLYAARPFTKYTEQTIASIDELLRQLAEIRIQGYAVDEGEYIPGVFCIAAPVCGPEERVVAAISVSVPSVRADSAARSQIVETVSAAALRLSKELGSAAAQQPSADLSPSFP